MMIFANKPRRPGPGANLRAKKRPSARAVSVPISQAQHTQARQVLAQVSALHRNIEIHPAGDRFEKEADRMAEDVLRTHDSAGHLNPGADSTNARPRRAARGGFPDSGQPLSDSVRSYFEPRFGHDFSQVRVHAHASASLSARALGASAYARGGELVFGEGQFAPETGEGRRLLAHELAHVVQQDRGHVRPGIQRRLLVTGESKDAEEALRILEPASGLSLKRNAKTGEISVTAGVLKPLSVSLAAELLTIIDDPKQDSEIHAVHKDPSTMTFGILYGAFPDDHRPLVQEVRIDQIRALEKGAPGAGAFTLAHEIFENYEAHAPDSLEFDKESDQAQRNMLHSSVHPLAEARANLVAADLQGPGERRALFEVPVGKPPKQVNRGIEDMDQYFLVWDRSSDGNSTISNARKADRIRVSKYTVHGFSADSEDVPAIATGVIAVIAGEMKQNPTASAFFEGFASAGKTPEKNKLLARKWAFLAEAAVFDKAQDDIVVNHNRFYEEGNSAPGRNSVEVTIDRPSS